MCLSSTFAGRTSSATTLNPGGNFSPVSLAPSSPRTTATKRDRTLRALLVASQVALSFVLIVAGVAFVRTLGRLNHVDTGYDATGVMTFSVSPSPADGPAASSLQFYEATLSAIRELPGVRLAAAAVAAPMATGGWRFGLSADNFDKDKDAKLVFKSVKVTN